MSWPFFTGRIQCPGPFLLDGSYVLTLFYRTDPVSESIFYMKDPGSEYISYRTDTMSRSILDMKDPVSGYILDKETNDA